MRWKILSCSGTNAGLGVGQFGKWKCGSSKEVVVVIPFGLV